MKNLILFAVLFSLLLLISACSDTVVTPAEIQPQEIYFNSANSVSSDIRTINSSGNNNYLILKNAVLLSSPRFKMLAGSFDSLFYYSSMFVTDLKGNNRIDLPLGNYKPVYAQLSPDSKKVLFTCDEGNYLMIINSDGTNLLQLSNAILGTENAVSFSPVSNQIAFIGYTADSGSALNIINTDGTGERIIKDSINYSNYNTLDWSNYGKIVFINTENQKSHLFTIYPDGSGLKRISPEPGDFDDSPAWSPDGSKIAFVTFINMIVNVCIINEDGTGKIILSPSSQEYQYSPRWSLDGKKILFTTRNLSNTEGKIKVYNTTTNTTTILTDGGPAFWNLTIVAIP
jgi:TolB protein